MKCCRGNAVLFFKDVPLYNNLIVSIIMAMNENCTALEIKNKTLRKD